MTNKEYAATSRLFRKACSLVGTEPTPRQAAKFQTRRGKAFKFYNEAKKELLDEARGDEEASKSVAEKLNNPMAEN